MTNTNSSLSKKITILVKDNDINILYNKILEVELARMAWFVDVFFFFFFFNCVDVFSHSLICKIYGCWGLRVHDIYVYIFFFVRYIWPRLCILMNIECSFKIRIDLDEHWILVFNSQKYICKTCGKVIAKDGTLVFTGLGLG